MHCYGHFISFAGYPFLDIKKQYKRMIKQYLLLVLLCFLTVIGWNNTLWAQDDKNFDLVEKRYTLYFKLNQTNVDYNLKDNKSTIQQMVDDINEILQKEGTVPHNLHIIASASPEGPVALNRRLASQRAERVKGLLIQLFPEYKNEKIVVEYVINDWDGVILDIRRHKESLKHSEQILKILENPNYTNKQKDSIIRRMPAAFEEIRYSMMDNQRTASITFTIKEPKKPEPQPEPAPEPEPQPAPDTVKKVEEIIPEPEPTPIIYKAPEEEKWSLNWRLKTNTIGWAMGHFNIAVEMDVAEHWSVAVPFYYSGGFNYFKETLKFRGIVVQPELRYYFSSQNVGWYTGAHFGLGWYNYALDGEYRIQDYKGERPAYGGGLALGYAYNFKKNANWGMEFSIGAGIYDAVYDKFYNEPNGHYAETAVHKTFIGIDNASVSFIYRIGNKLKARKEGKK